MCQQRATPERVCYGADFRESHHHDQAEEAAGKETRSMVEPTAACDTGLQMLPWRFGAVLLHGGACKTAAGTISGVIFAQGGIFFAEFGHLFLYLP